MPRIRSASEILKTLTLLRVKPDQVVELRALAVSTLQYRRPHVVAGFFDENHLDAFIEASVSLNRASRGVYVSMNPFDPALLSRSANRVQPDIATTSDADIMRRLWILVDIDAGNPSGTSAVEQEHQAAIDLVVQHHSIEW